ncbi:MAG: hypothetical protein U0X75_27460 [Acidobacteriota bacterium]
MNLAMLAARSRAIWHYDRSSRAHEDGDPEFEIFPPHCLSGTPGAERAFAALPELPKQELAVTAAADAQRNFAAARHYREEKVFDLFSNACRTICDNAACSMVRIASCLRGGDGLLRALLCAGLAAAGARVQLVSDATRRRARHDHASPG